MRFESHSVLDVHKIKIDLDHPFSICFKAIPTNPPSFLFWGRLRAPEKSSIRRSGEWSAPDPNLRIALVGNPERFTEAYKKHNVT